MVNTLSNRIDELNSDFELAVEATNSEFITDHTNLKLNRTSSIGNFNSHTLDDDDDDNQEINIKTSSMHSSDMNECLV